MQKSMIATAKRKDIVD